MRKRKVIELTKRKYCGWGRKNPRMFHKAHRNKWHKILDAINKKLNDTNMPKFKCEKEKSSTI